MSAPSIHAAPAGQREKKIGRCKVFFVGDNRSNVNWGRSASIALRQLLNERMDVVGTVTGDLLAAPGSDAGYIETLLPPRHHRIFRYFLERRNRRPFSWYVKFEEFFGARDFIANDPVISVNNLLANEHRYPELGRICRQARQADLLVLDGDGDIILSTPPRRHTLFLLAMMELGLRLRKPVFLVNSMISDCPVTGRNDETLAAARRLFSQCRAVAMRDPESLEYVRREMPEANAILIPDSLFSWAPLYADENSRPPRNGDFLLPFPEQEELWAKLDFSEPYICIGGGALSGSEPERAAECYGHLVDAIAELGFRLCLTENDQPDSFLRQVAREKNIGLVPVNAPILLAGAVLVHARLFISGRYHPSIFASLGGTPCVFLGSHAHKMGSLSRVLEYGTQQEFPAFPSDSDIAQIVAAARQLLQQGETLRNRIRRIAAARCNEARSLPEFVSRQMHD